MTVIVILFFVAGAVGIHLFAPHFFPAIVTAVARPFWRVQFSVINGAIHSPEYLLERNQLLQSQIEEMQTRLDTMVAIELENRQLKELYGRSGYSPIDSTVFGFEQSTSSPINIEEEFNNPDARILAAVIKRPPFSIYDELVIDIGKDYELSTSSMVYSSGGVLIGKVVDVSSKTARVRLLSSPGETYEVLIGDSNTPATAFGRGGGQYDAQVSRDMNIKEGDFVMNPSLNDKPLGMVSAVLIDPAQPFKTILFAPPINIYQLRWVLVENRE